MVNSNLLLCLYARVLEDTSFVNGVSEKDVKQAIEHMHKVYKGSSDSLSKSFNSFADFNKIAYRCAYLFKYAPFHTALAYKAMSHALTESPNELQTLVDSLQGPLKLCSLGSGPGADVIGVIAAMHNQFGFFRSSVKLVDIMSEWELTFWSVLDEVRQQNYGPLSESMSEKWLDWSYMTADLQSKINSQLTEVLETADLITMVKFVSAAACKETSTMIEKIFRIMKPGAFVMFIDNAAGGFKELISSAAKKYKFIAISTPLKHQPYINEHLKNIKYGFKSCYESKIAMQLLMKSCPANYSSGDNLIRNWSSNEDFSISPISQRQKLHAHQFQNFTIGPKTFDDSEIFEPPVNYSNESSLITDWPCNGNPTSPALQRQMLRTPRFQNFRIDQNPVNNPFDDSETFGSPFNYSNESSLITDWSCNENVPTTPVSQWQKLHTPQFQNFRIGQNPVDNPFDNPDTFESPFNYSNESSLITDWSCNENVPTTPVSQWQKIHMPQFQNFRIGQNPVDKFTDDHEIIKSSSNWHVNNFLSYSELTPRMKKFKELIDCPENFNESFESQPFSRSTPCALASQNWPVIKTSHDSGYFDESFQSESLWNSPQFDSSPHFKASQSLVRYRIPKKSTSQTFHENEPFSNSSNDTPRHSAIMPVSNHEHSSAPIPYNNNFQQLGENIFNYDLPLHPSRNKIRQPFRIMQQSKRYQREKSRRIQSKNGLLPLPRQYLRNYKVPSCRKVLMHQHKPYLSKAKKV